jgi:hypothetical protein
MSGAQKVNLAINVQSHSQTYEIVDWLHKMANAVVGIPQIGKVVLLRFRQQEISTGENELFSQISPQIVCYQSLAKLQEPAGNSSIGWWWNVGLHYAFNTMPYPDYVFHYAYDISWSSGTGNTVVARKVCRDFVEATGNSELVVGSFSASAEISRPTPQDEHPKNRIESKIKSKIQESFPQFNCARPRSEFFVIERDFYYKFNKDIPPDEFYDDLTVQLLLYAHFNGHRISEFPMGAYYAPLEDYDAEKETKQVERIDKIIQWAKLRFGKAA